MNYNYIVWVGGCDDYYVNYSDAIRDYWEWIDKGYGPEELCIEFIGKREE